MAIHCLTASRFTMKATILHRMDAAPSPNPDEYGEWVDSQDPLTGEIVKVWVPTPVDDTGTPEDETVNSREFNCLARGIVDGGIRVAGTTERFGDTYENIDFVKMWAPPNILISKRDRITNIKDSSGRIRWVDEEGDIYGDGDVTLKATVFNVNGVTPLFDAFNRCVEQFILLERAQVS